MTKLFEEDDVVDSSNNAVATGLSFSFVFFYLFFFFFINIKCFIYAVYIDDIFILQ